MSEDKKHTPLPYRVAYLDPDFRANPKGDTPCCRCMKAIKNKSYRMVHLLNNDPFAVVHPDDSHLVPADLSNGLHPIGNDCARVVGLEFTYEPKPNTIEVAKELATVCAKIEGKTYTQWVNDAAIQRATELLKGSE